MALATASCFSSCDVNFDNPPVISPDLGGDGKWDSPLTAQGVTAYYNAYYSSAPDASKFYWATGYIVGCVNTTETVFVCNDQTAAFAAPFESQSNLLLAPTPDCTDYNQCISLQLPSGNVRNSLNLNGNPSNLGRQVTVRGYIDKYLGIPGLRSVSHFVWGPIGEDTGDVEVGKSDFTLLTGDITSGRAYALVANNTAAQTVTAQGNNGFLYTEAVTIASNKFNASEQFGFMFTETAAGSGQYYITDYKGQFLFQAPYGSGWSNRPSVAKNPEKDNNAFFWAPVKNGEGRWVISNVASGSILAYDTSYKSYGIYNSLSDQYLAPELYEMANDPSVTPDFTPTEPGNPGDITEGTGEGTLQSPYNVARALAIINGGAASADKVYVKGKISKIDNIDTSSYGNATYFISDDGTENNQLEVFRGYGLNGAKFTSADAIKVGDEVVILGQLVLFGSTPEVTTGSSIVTLNGQGGGDTPNPPAGGDGDGTEASPYNVAKIIALNPSSTTESPAGGAGVYVKGYIVGYMPSTPKTTLDNTVFGAPADLKTNIVLGPAADCKDYTQCIAIQLPNNAVRTALNLQDNPSVLGKAVTLYGDVMKYCSAPGLKNTSKYTLEGGGDTPNPPAGSTIYEGLVSNMDGWTVDNVTIPDAASYIWQWKEYNGSGYLNASCYISGTAYASEAYAYTAVDLSGKNDATLTFDHAAKFQTTLKTLCCLVVREAGSSAWTTLNIPEWPAAGAWTFASSGSISLKAYAGKKIEIGFKYGSSASGSDTWEIKNFLIKG